MLDTLYLLCDAYLEGRGGPGSRDARMLRTADLARARWTGPASAMQGYLSTMPDRYVLANTADAICAHAGVVLARSDRPVHAALVPSRHGGFGEICVVARDRPGLLARIAAAITASRLEVLGADVYSRKGPSGIEAVDLFWVKGRGDGSVDLGRVLPRLVADLTQVCEGAIHPRDLLRDRLGEASPWRERPSPAIATEVVIDDRASTVHTVLEVFTKDRPGLLYVVAQALADLGLSIALSKINTEGTKVADVFYVQELDGSKVSGEDRFKAIRAALLSALTEDQARPTTPEGAQA
jgi:[protein-PII] uridylyltransferase